MIPPPACQGGATHTNSQCYVYLLKSRTTGKLYLGWTTNFLRRLEGHASGAAVYTRLRGPWQRIGWEAYPTPEEAKGRERSLKRNPRMFILFKKRLVNLAQTTRGGLRQVVG